MLCSGHIDTQVKEECKLNQLRSRLETADLTVMDEGAAICCYAHSDTSWVQDPAGIPWEATGQWQTPSFPPATPTVLKVPAVRTGVRRKLPHLSRSAEKTALEYTGSGEGLWV